MRPMRLMYAARGAASSYRARERMARTGRTPNGHRLWTTKEDDIVRALYPNYKALRRKLRSRSYSAIRYRASVLDVIKRRHVWLGSEVQRLRRLYPKASREAIMQALPGLRWGQIAGKAGHIRVFRHRQRLCRTGHPIIDLIRDRAFDLNLSMVELDSIARSKTYFQKAGWRTSGVNRKAILRAVEALGGEVSVQWQ